MPFRAALSALLGLAAVGLALALALGDRTALVAEAQAAPSPSPRHADPATAPRASVVYPATAGPFIDAQVALDTTTRLASGPIARTAIGRIPYAQAATWMGSTTYTIDPARQVYLVVVQGAYQPPRAMGLVKCVVYFAVVDATDGIVRASGCRDFSGQWPTLPAGVQ